MVNDSISRQQAIEAIVNAVSRIGLHDNSEVARYGATFRQQEILDIIDALPSAQPERKKGRWINRSLNVLYPEWERYTCSVCGKHSDNYDFCPTVGQI